MGLVVEVKEEEKTPEIVFRAEIERLMKKALRLFDDFDDSDHRVFLINKLEEIREYLIGNSTKEG